MDGNCFWRLPSTFWAVFMDGNPKQPDLYMSEKWGRLELIFKRKMPLSYLRGVFANIKIFCSIEKNVRLPAYTKQ